MRRLDRARSAARRGDPQRAARVAAERRRGHPRRQRRGAAAARSARDAVQRPRIADLVGGAAGRELMGVGVAEQDHALRAQPRPHDGVLGGDVALQHPAGRGERQARDAVEVLERQRDPAQQRAPPRPRPRRSSAARACSRASSGYRRDPRVDRIGRALGRGRAAVALLDARQARLGELGRREPALAQERLPQARPGQPGSSPLRCPRSSSSRPASVDRDYGAGDDDSPVLQSLQRHGLSPRLSRTNMVDVARLARRDVRTVTDCSQSVRDSVGPGSASAQA